MAYYQSNYPNSGPPPPPGQYGGYGYGGGGQYNSAYNVNQYGYQQQQPQYGGGGHNYVAGQGAVPGFTVPAVQQYSQMNQGQHGPPPMAMPTTGHIQNYDSHLYQYQMQQQQMMMQQMQMMQMQMMKTSVQDDGDGAEQTEESSGGMSEEDMKEKMKVMMKETFVKELVRRERVSGTFEMTSGTVKPLEKYEAGDPVVEWYNTERGEDLTDKPWSKDADCEYLNEAMKGAGTNEDAIITVVASRCNSQRQELKKYFKTMYGKDLIEELKSELSGDFKEAIMACFVKPAIYDAWCIKEAIYGPGTDEETLIEILMTRTNAQIAELREVYGDVVSPHKKTSESLIEKDIEDDTSGDFKRLLISASTGNRNEISQDQLEEAVQEIIREDGEGTGMYEVNYEALCDMDRAKREAEQLYKAGEARWGTDEETFNRIFSTRDYYSLRAIWKEYVKITQRDILNSVDRETSGDFKAGLRALVMNIRCRPMYFAERLQKAMKGLGTKDSALIRLIVSRSEIDMVQIKECFLKLTDQTVWKWLENDCSGDYRKLLQALVGLN
ncbi:annexin A7 [Patella vulgata]|uniref:annexin A7 n=1 Tax=Patella vulgata TaxID=6465 RepID=UPI00217F691C|nr:annexin A7 [Patella vulgata]